MKLVEIFAHRGASADEHENTLAAFRAAVAAGADGVELDVRRCATNELVVHHDPVLTSGSALIDVALAELPEHIPLLSEALIACESLTINIEIKNIPNDPDFDVENLIVKGVLDIVNALNVQSQVIISSFNLSTINEVKSQAPQVRTAWLLAPSFTSELVRRAADAGHDGVHPHHSMVNSSFMEMAKLHSLFVNAWTVDEPTEVLRLVAEGVDGIITNVPGSTRALLENLQP